jgi:hypothetical protein
MSCVPSFRVDRGHRPGLRKTLRIYRQYFRTSIEIANYCNIFRTVICYAQPHGYGTGAGDPGSPRSRVQGMRSVPAWPRSTRAELSRRLADGHRFAVGARMHRPEVAVGPDRPGSRFHGQRNVAADPAVRRVSARAPAGASGLQGRESPVMPGRFPGTTPLAGSRATACQHHGRRRGCCAPHLAHPSRRKAPAIGAKTRDELLHGTSLRIVVRSSSACASRKRWGRHPAVMARDARPSAHAPHQQPRPAAPDRSSAPASRSTRGRVAAIAMPPLEKRPQPLRAAWNRRPCRRS